MDLLENLKSFVNMFKYVSKKKDNLQYQQCLAKFCWRMLEKLLRNICSWC